MDQAQRGDVSVLIRVQHAEGRDEPLARLLTGLPSPVEVVTDLTDGEPNPWRGFQRCLASVPEHYSHVAILQDDTIVSRNFLPTLVRIAEANPDTIVSLFMASLPRRTSTQVRLTYGKVRYVDVHPHDFIPVVATLWPRQKTIDILAWVAENGRRLRGNSFRSDDAAVTRWASFTRQRVRVTVPSIVEHPDDVPSTITTRARGGKDTGRVALFWIGDADPLELDW